MFELGFGEIALLAIVLLVVVGPRELPSLLRAVGRGIARLRNLSWELRSQSGIDEIIRDEDLQKDIEAVRSLSKGRIVDAIVSEAMRPPPPDPYRPAEDVEDGDGEVAPAQYSRPQDDEETPAKAASRSRAATARRGSSNDSDDEQTEPIEVERPERGRPQKPRPERSRDEVRKP